MKKHKFWFDLMFTYKEIEMLEKVRGKKTQMQYIEDIILASLAQKTPHETELDETE